MLDRLAKDQPLGVSISLWKKADNNARRDTHTRQNQLRRGLTARFQNALKKSVEGIIEAGRVLIEAKNQLDHGQFIDWVVNDLRFGARGNRGPDLRKAQVLMFVARNEVISNACNFHAFPPCLRTLWELTQIRPKQRLLDLIANGTINPGMTGEEAVALRHKTSREPSPTPKLKRGLASLVDVGILLGGGDGVLAHIRELKELTEFPTAKEIDKAALWAKRKLAERRRRAE
jgi:hypothetical protein